MASISKLTKSLFLLVLPVIILIIGALIGIGFWLLQKASTPPTAMYLVTPEKFVGLSSRGAKITDETWANKDGSSARGWLLRGSEGLPSIILLHRYGADRSHLLNLGVKLNEVTNFTILMPDLRGHGDTPLVKSSTLGGCEADDVASVIEFIKGLKTDDKKDQVGKDIGIYGVELGAFTALSAAVGDTNIKALALDSVPANQDELLDTVVQKRYPFASFITSKIAGYGTYFYYQGCYKSSSVCITANSLTNRKILLLAGVDVPSFKQSTVDFQKCLPKQDLLEAKTDLTVSGFSVIGASGEQAEAYDQRVIEFFKKALSNNP
jgi:pimeloyl-ACP methyl ester carboxylesterase